MSATAAVDAGAPAHRGWITVSVMLATIMQVLDTTIANVALPHMQGSMGATYEQISWVLTSYIVAAAIFIPLSGFLAVRLGRKRVLLWSVIGFTIASMLCGAAQSLPQIVAFRILQGVCGASLVPLSQSVLLDAYPREQHGSAMALWGLGVMVGPILGPTLGGWLTEYYDWRWVFYINLPFGILAWFGIGMYVHESGVDRSRRFDLFGFAMLALGIGALQMMLDRGGTLDWFASTEIVVEAVLAGTALYLFAVQMTTHERPFLEPALFRDRNFDVGLLLIFVVGMILLSTMALLPPFLQNLLGYPVFDVGLLLAPRGVGTAAAMLVIGRLSGSVDVRLQLLAGLALTAVSLWEMTYFSLDTSGWDVVRTGIVQGIGLGFLFVPLSAVSFSTLAPVLRNEATALYSLVRSLGMSISVSIVVTQLARATQAEHARLVEFLNPFSLPLRGAVESGAIDTTTPQGLALLNAEVTRQAAALAYVQDFRLMMWITIASAPLVLLLRPGSYGSARRARAR
ncbi:MAG: DHA2 family efflux MFS transporter permease subunit [Burkholderiaceae bacterium]|nr:DHA2 family efflux MFS transporter permease subunit [Burkholderiaceae bacterium]